MEQCSLLTLFPVLRKRSDILSLSVFIPQVAEIL